MRLRVVLALCFVHIVCEFYAQGQHAYRQLREFGFIERAASQPLSGLTEGPGDWLYGASLGGNGGVIYRVKKDGTWFSIMFNFATTNGTPSRGPLIVGSDGALYGTVIQAGSIDGALYKIDTNGTGYQVYPLPLPAQVVSGVIEASDGRLYGTSFGGGAYDGGTVFRVNRDGSEFAVLHDFGSGASDGLQPVGEPVEGADGALYVATAFGGAENAGTVCRLSKSAPEFSVLHHFPALGTNDGRMPNSRLAIGPGGNLYGTTEAGGIGGEDDVFGGYGVVYRLSIDGEVYSVVRRFQGGINDGQRPRNVFVGSDGMVYGTSQNAAYAHNVDGIFRMDTSGNGFNLVYTWVTFDNQSIQLNPVFQSADGFFYGTSAAGGASDAGQAFKVQPNGTQYLNLHEFSSTGADGSTPGTLVLDADGTLYGLTLDGGANDSGTIYKLEPDGTYQVLHEFAPASGFPLGLLAASDGFLYGSSYFSREIFRIAKDGSGHTVLTNLEDSAPVGPLIEASDFLLYGVTENGAVFRLNSDGTDLLVIHSITNSSDDPVSPAGVMEASDGRLYGTSLRGGANNQGMVFRLNKDGSEFQVLYSFVGPIGTLLAPNPIREASDGYLYGTTYRGGGNNRGSIYRISMAGAFEFLHAFAVGGGGPIGQLAEGPNGWLHGVTQDSGNFDGGHLFRFKLGPASPIYILHHFGEGNLGRNPAAAPVIGAAGEIYGTTQYGGFGEGFGTIFRVDVAPILAVRRAGAGSLELSWPWNGETYHIEATPDLASFWSYYAPGPANTGERVIATVPLATDAQYFRLASDQPAAAR